MIPRIGLIILWIFLAAGKILAQKNSTVSFEKWLSLKQVNSSIISDDGSTVAFTMIHTNWQNNSYDNEIWIQEGNENPIQLTRTEKGGSTEPYFIKNGKWLSFLADRGNKMQVFIIPVQGGEAIQVTHEESGIKEYVWNRQGSKLAFIKEEAESKSEKENKKRYGSYDIEDSTFNYSHLWIMNFDLDSLLEVFSNPCFHGKPDTNHVLISDCYRMPIAKKLTKGPFSVNNPVWNPDGTSIAVDVLPDSRIKSSGKSDIGLVNINSGLLFKVIDNSGSDSFGAWSPDGKEFVYTSSLEDTTSNYYKNNHILIYNILSRQSRECANEIDENKSIVDWNSEGIYCLVNEKMRSYLWNIQPLTGKLRKEKLDLDVINSARFSFSGKFKTIIGRKFDQLSEVYSLRNGENIQPITHLNNQIADWQTPTNEIINWKSKDGASIEGILLKPRNYDPHKKYPLLVVIHGGPTGTDRPEPAPTYVYPIVQWCEKGALVLRLNYRGSAGYGEKFRSLNVGNLGIGDMWDVMSGINYLKEKNLIDTSKMGCMGWSQGGYISAFLTTHTSIFKAISVGAGISDWMTYYVNTDITPFTPQYLKSTPWENQELYQKTSPIHSINHATTPTLIQHGELDKRVPIPNAYELYRGLKDRDITTRFIVYKGFGHGITKPRERLAAVWHNWQWFNHYIFGDPEEKMLVE